jgi:hypothetical protein
MKTAARLTVAERDRALRRLRTMTVGTAIASVTALGGFSSVAAVTYSGSSGGQTAVAAESTTAGTLTSDTTTSTTTSTTTTATPTPSLQPAATTATTSRNAQVTTGGS